MEGSLVEIFLSQCSVRRCVIREASRNCDLTLNFSCFTEPVRSCSRIMFYKMLFDRFVDFAYLYTVLDMPRQIRIVCLHKVAVLCFVNNGKTQHRARANWLCVDLQCGHLQCWNHVRTDVPRRNNNFCFQTVRSYSLQIVATNRYI